MRSLQGCGMLMDLRVGIVLQDCTMLMDGPWGVRSPSEVYNAYKSQGVARGEMEHRVTEHLLRDHQNK